MTDYPNICVITQPLGESDKPATRDLLEILAAITTVSLITIDLPSDSAIWDEHEVIEISEKGMGSTPHVAALRFLYNQVLMCRAIWNQDEELILFYGAMAYVVPIAFARLIGKTVVVEPRADVPLSLKLQWEQQLPDVVAYALAGLVRTLERTGYRLSHAIIAYSPGMAEQLNLNTYEEKLYTNGARFVDTEKFCVETPFEERDRVVGYVGRFAEEKGIRTLAAVATELPDDVTFRFVGDGPLREWVETELAAEIESGSVEIRGWVAHDEVPAELNELRLLVLPSEPTEGLPTLILESMACGTPVYATPVSGVVDVVQNGCTGYYIESSDPTVVANEVTKVIENEKLSVTSETARQLVFDDFRFDAAIGRYQNILEEISAY